MRVTMDAKGRLVIPAEIRAEAGLSADAPLEIRVRDGKVEIEAATTNEAAAPPMTTPSAASASAGRVSALSLVKGRAAGSSSGTTSARREGERSAKSAPALDLLIRMAIAHRRLVDLVYDDRRKLIEPHDYGERAGEARLLVYQLSGESRTSSSSGWRELRLPLITDFKVRDDTFRGGRPADRHITWDHLYARVAPSAPDAD
jgi:AbrB family looped-hinge helix DNA binding protein